MRSGLAYPAVLNAGAVLRTTARDVRHLDEPGLQRYLKDVGLYAPKVAELAMNDNHLFGSGPDFSGLGSIRLGRGVLARVLAVDIPCHPAPRIRRCLAARPADKDDGRRWRRGTTSME